MLLRWLVTLLLLLFARAAEVEKEPSTSTVSEKNKKVDVTPSRFESGLSDIQWLRDDHSVVMVLTNRGRVWRSANNGKTFSDVTSKIIQQGASNASASRRAAAGFNRTVYFETLKVHPSDKNYAVVLTKGLSAYLTSNAGITWYSLGQNAYIHNWIWHPVRPSHALFSEWSEGCRGRSPRTGAAHECNHKLYLTTNGGRTAEKIADFVIQYSWGDKSLEDHQGSVFITQHGSVKAHQPRTSGWHAGANFYKLTDWGRSKELLVKGGNKFLVSRNYIFVATVEDPLRQTVSLMVSNNGGRDFRRANIPTRLMEKSYTILDTSEGNVIIHVNHGSEKPGLLEGNVYVSDESGLRFALSLPNNIRAANGECEFDRVLGVDGVYLANMRDDLSHTDVVKMGAIQEEGDVSIGASADALDSRHNAKPKKTATVIRTVISFDKGGSWNFLKPPAVDSVGRPISCPNTPDKCWLHLHGITQFDRFAPFYSAENALGLIMGTGNVGSHLTKESQPVNTYISRDAGRTWEEAHKGGFIYEYGDHGGLVVMAHDSKKTDQVVFSWNEGRSWYDFSLGMDNVSVDNIIIEPTSTAMEFLLYGTVGDQGVLFHMDFNTLNQPFCKGVNNVGATTSDYEYWYTDDGSRSQTFTSNSSGVVVPDSGGSGCLLGRRVRYIRKKPSAECFNGRDFKRKPDKMPCECTKDDYMCEIGFFRPVNSPESDCEPSPYEDRDYMDVEGCTSSGVYYTHAWRKVPGDQCVNGWQPTKVPVPCPPDSPLATQARATIWTLMLFAAGLGGLAWASKHPVLKQYVQQTGIDQFVEVGYSVVGRAGESVQRGGEELFNFWTGRPDESAASVVVAPPHAAGSLTSSNAIEMNKANKLDMI